MIPLGQFRNGTSQSKRRQDEQNEEKEKEDREACHNSSAGEITTPREVNGGWLLQPSGRHTCRHGGGRGGRGSSLLLVMGVDWTCHIRVTK